MKIKLLSKIMILVLLVGIVYSYPNNVSAKEEYSIPDLTDGKNCTMTITLNYKQEDLGNIMLLDKDIQVYEVAKMNVMNNKLVFTLLEPFAQTGINFIGMNAEKSKEYAKQLEKETSKKNAIVYTPTTYENGKATFENLEPAMYLVVVNREKNNKGKEYIIDSYLVMVPQIEKENDTLCWNYEVNTIPKYELSTQAPSNTPVPTNSASPTPSGSIIRITSHPYYGSSSSWNTPKTGDDTNVALWWCIFVGSFAGIITAIVAGSKKNKKAKK